jgi:hypothetical protein
MNQNKVKLSVNFNLISNLCEISYNICNQNKQKLWAFIQSKYNIIFNVNNFDSIKTVHILKIVIFNTICSEIIITIN